MSRIILYIATSLDGYIARADGSVDWLDRLPNPDQNDYGYHAFLEGVDTIVMGRKSYEEVLGFGIGWPYVGCKTFILTRDTNYSPTTPDTQILSRLDENALKRIRSGSQKNIWLVGGGEVITAFLRIDAIDEIILFIAPLMLGSGIPLFADSLPERFLELIDSHSYASGLVCLRYRKGPKKEGLPDS